MGAGILPICIHNGTVYFLFGKENKFADTPGWSDFGGGTEAGESFLTTATREAGEELTGFLGSAKRIKALLKQAYIIEFDTYRMHLVTIPYDEALVKYYNNNAAFIHDHLEPATIKKYRIFEKSEIAWIPAHKLASMRPKFRSYFRAAAVDKLIAQKSDIYKYVSSKQRRQNKQTCNCRRRFSNKSTARKTRRT